MRFLTCNHNFGVLTINATYKLGEFYVTPMTYPHLMLQDVKTNEWAPYHDWTDTRSSKS